MNFKTPLLLLGALATTMLASSCSSTVPAGSVLAAYHEYDRPTKLPKNPTNVRVTVSLSKQRAYVMEGNEMLLVMPVSVGTSSSPTPTGNFRITSKAAKHRAIHQGYAYKGDKVKQTYLSKRPPGWSFKGTPMPYWCEFKPDYGFHTGWIKHHPSTDGCIRMHENLAPKFFRLVSQGTPVNIAYSQPEDAIYGKIPLPPDAGPLPNYDLSMYLGDEYFTRHRKPTYD
jgi:L,D-transpeptidase catalytic domain